MSSKNMTQKKPYSFDAQPGVIYSWCSCGISAKSPLCDGSHRDLADGKRSVKFQVDSDVTVMLCGCTKTKNPPYCDGSHNTCK